MSEAAATLPEAVLLAGPTCAGKTALALELAERFPVEIVSVDSAQVYRGMDVGTSKPSTAVRARVPHHLIDICDPAERYNAGQFRRDALELISRSGREGACPCWSAAPCSTSRVDARHRAVAAANADLRAQIDERARRLGWPALHAELAARDPAAASRIRTADGSGSSAR